MLSTAISSAAPPESAMPIVNTPSVSGKHWVFSQTNEADVLFLQQTYKVSAIAARLALHRMENLEKAAEVFEPLIKNHMPDPSHLPDAELAYEHIYTCLQEGRKIGIWGDYDVDGACSSALLIKTFRALGLKTLPYIPDRFQEGYGPNINGLLTLKQQGVSDVVVVDCGTTSLETMAMAKKNGIAITIIDHHRVGDEYPDVRSFINPKRPDFQGPLMLRELCAGGLVFLFLVGLMRFLREKNYFNETHVQPDLFSLLDLVALSTICDMMPLRHLNRAFVTQGLKVMRQRRNIGLASLIDASGIKEIPNSVHLGYTVGPRINAGGRIGDSTLGVQLLSCDDAQQSLALAAELNDLNQERQSIERLTLEKALLQAKMQENSPYIFVYGEDWHEGVLGIIASNLKEHFHKPAFVLAGRGDSFKGSIRSVHGVDISDVIHKACLQNLLSSGGGHPMAGGLTLPKENLQPFRNFIEEFFQNNPIKETSTELAIDMPITFEQIRQSEFFKCLELLGPFGVDHPQPRFLLSQIYLKNVRPFGYNHLRMHGVQANGKSQNIVCFRCADKKIGQWLMENQSRCVDCVVTIQVNRRWGSQRAMLILEDARN